MADIVSEQPTPLARPKPEPSVSRRRFAVAYLVLAAIVGVAVGLVVVFGTRDDGHQQKQAWSSWAPQATGTLGVREIARHVSGRYHLENGALFTSVVAGPMQIESSQGPIPVSAILIRSGRAGVAQERLDIAFPESGVFYQLVGAGANRAIPGRATLARGRLVRREALELALYTFHYLPQADYVLAFMPPPAGVSQQSPLFNRAVFLPRSALGPELQTTLENALPPGEVKMTPGSLTPAQANGIEMLTAGRVFHYDFQQAADQSVLVILSPVTG
ncbi:MAG: hypothetical protein ACM3QU_12970 [Verrucomicrobiota bacterium]